MSLPVNLNGLGPNTFVSTSDTAATPLQIAPADYDRMKLIVQADPANTQPVKLLLGNGVPSATNYHLILAPGQICNLVDAEVVWGGAVQMWCSAAASVSVVEL